MTAALLFNANQERALADNESIWVVEAAKAAVRMLEFTLKPAGLAETGMLRMHFKGYEIVVEPRADGIRGGTVVVVGKSKVTAVAYRWELPIDDEPLVP